MIAGVEQKSVLQEAKFLWALPGVEQLLKWAWGLN
jgi:hypothetical protein